MQRSRIYRLDFTRLEIGEDTLCRPGLPVTFQEVVHSSKTREADCDEQSVPPCAKGTLAPTWGERPSPFRTYRVPMSIQTLQISSTYSVPGKKLVWNLMSAADLKADENVTSHSSSAGMKN
jgi:hypothetical protein